MADYQKVRGSHELSIRIADLLEDTKPQQYNGANRVETVRTVNDILQGRSKQTADDLISDLRNIGGEGYGIRVENVSREIQAFLRQKELLCVPYKNICTKEYAYGIYDSDPLHPMKAIDQELYDDAVKNGFTSDFFREAYFDRVTFYCLPDYADFTGSVLWECSFSACRIHDAKFEDTAIYGTEFQSCSLKGDLFIRAIIAHGRFRDCDIQQGSFGRSLLKSCSFTDCTMNGTGFQKADLDGTTFGRIAASGIHHLDTATITQGGATEEEVRQLRTSIYAALQVPDTSGPREKTGRTPHRRRGPAPER